MATVRHAGRWLHQRPLIAGDPLSGVKDLQTDAPEWNGLTSKQLMRLKSACEQRKKICTRKNQNALLETANFLCVIRNRLTRIGISIFECGAISLERASFGCSP
ncbi:hypothetical protein [Legionella jamestowniensis]|uniref:Integrase n=1 Tax=Legionella jamestowniensis TaxID=455 RepID=A0A0W0UHZ3_9GAMM|nr:hypothetical protein [Legionella jamestowniensis]KTD07193.1 integrase [Legionella jamestowniensis]